MISVDVEMAKSHLPRGEQAERTGEKVGEPASADIDEVVSAWGFLVDFHIRLWRILLYPLDGGSMVILFVNSY
jgi:hypothetical protein